MSPRSLDVGPLEMRVLGLLEETPGRTVAEIQAALKEFGHDLAYTTVMTVLVRLFNKGYLKRAKEGRRYRYSSARQAGSASRALLDKVRKTLFRNERLKPILALLDSGDELTQDELKELRRAVDERLKKQGRAG